MIKKPASIGGQSTKGMTITPDGMVKTSDYNKIAKTVPNKVVKKETVSPKLASKKPRYR